MRAQCFLAEYGYHARCEAGKTIRVRSEGCSSGGDCLLASRSLNAGSGNGPGFCRAGSAVGLFHQGQFRWIAQCCSLSPQPEFKGECAREDLEWSVDVGCVALRGLAVLQTGRMLACGMCGHSSGACNCRIFESGWRGP